MAYGIIKVDNITFDNGGSDQNVTVSGLYRATTSGVTVSGTIAAATVSGVTIIGSTTVSGATVTGTTANFTSGNFGNIISSAATMSGALIMANQQQVRFREAVGNGVNHIALQAPTIVSADQTITLPDQTGTVVTTGDNGSVTSTMILDGTILNVDINASAGIVDTKLATIATAGKVSNSATTATNANTASAIVARDASGNFTAGTITAALIGAASSNVLKAGDTMTGALVVPLASAATPSLTFTSDLNTGIYSPGADQLAVSTGGTGRLFVDASGSVGIGTSTPSARLQVNAPSTGRSYSSSVLDFSNIHLDGITADTTTSALTFSSGGGGGAAIAFSRGGNFQTEIGFWTCSTAGTNSATERVRIDSSGNVGIGTSSPRGLVSISNNLSGTGVVDSSLHFGFSTLDYYGFRIVNSNEPASTGAGLLKFQRGNTTSWLDAFVINNSGNVGIGTSSPRFALSIGSAVAVSTATPDTLDLGATFSPTPGANPKLRVYEDGIAPYGFGVTNSQLEYICPTSASHVFFTAGTEKARIVSSGNVGIGTSSPSQKLHVSGGDAANVGFNGTTKGVRFDFDGTQSTIYGVDNTFSASYQPLRIGGSITQFMYGGTEGARIDSSGRLLVGTSTSINAGSWVNATAGQAGLQQQIASVNWNEASIGLFSFETAVNAAPQLSFNKSTSNSLGAFGSAIGSGADIGSIVFSGSDGSKFVAGALIAAEVDGTTGTNDMPGRLVFSTTADGAASPTERLRITSAGVLQVADAGNITVGTTTGTKIGTATTEKLGFYNATPVVQPAAVADATTAVDVITQLNDLLAKLRTLGIIAT